MVGYNKSMRRLGFVSAVLLHAFAGMFGATAQTTANNSLIFKNETKIDPNNPTDPGGVWSSAELKDLIGGEEVRSLTRSAPSIVNYEATIGSDKHLVSVVVGPNCSTNACDIRHVVIHPDGSKEVVETTTQEFAIPDRGLTRGLADSGSLRLSPDGKEILSTPDLVDRGLSGETVQSLTRAGMPAACAPFAAKVSGSEGSFGTRSSKGCLGAFQFCPGTFEQYYDGTAEEFLANPKHQVQAWIKYEKVQWTFASRNNLQSLLGETVCAGSRCAKIDNSAILMGCQFGCGRNGKLHNLSKMTPPRDCNARSVKDGFNTSVCTYLVRGAGYDVSCFTGEDRGLLAAELQSPLIEPTQQVIEILRLRMPPQQMDKIGEILKALNQP